MASDGEVSCINDPNFAVICSFLNVFSKLCAISPPNVYELQEYVENTQEVLEPLKELHLKLLRRAFRSVRPDRWEKSLIKFCHQQLFHQEAWELERFGYKKASTHIKLKVLKVLLEYQFTCNSRFKNLANQIESTNLRQNPIGRDKQGCLYWLHVDHEANLRLYKEDQDEETWNLIASDRDGLVKIINMLKSGEDIQDDTLDTVNEDSNSIEPPTCEQKVDEQSNSERISKLESDKDQSNQPTEPLEQNHESIDNFDKNSLNNMESQLMVNDDESIEKELRQEDNEIIEYKDSSDESDEESCLLPNKRKKSESINEDKSKSIVSVSEEIEEPVLYVSGEGTGNDCESNAIYFSEEIVEPIFYIRGYGEGFACDTGNIGETNVENDTCSNDNKSNKIDQKHSSGSKLHNTIVSNDSNGGTELTQLEIEEASGAQDSSCSPINLSVGDSDANRERSCDNEQNRISDSAPLPVTKRFLQKIPKISLKNVSEHQSTSQKPVLWSINTLCSDTDDKVDDNECTLESKSGETKEIESNEKEEKCKTEVSIREGIFNNIGEKRNCDKPTPPNFLFGHPGCLKLSLSKSVSDPSDRREPIGNCEIVPVEDKEVLAYENEDDTDILNLKNGLESGQTPVKVPLENKVLDKEDALEDGDKEITSRRASNKIKDNSNSSSNGVLKKDKTQSDIDRETKLHGKHKVEDANKTTVQHVKEAVPDILPSKKLKLDGATEEVRHPLLDKNRDQNIDNEFVDSSKEPNGNIISENVSGNDTEVTEGTEFQLEDPLNIENCTTATEEDRDCERTSKIKDKRAYIKVKKAKAGKNKKKNNHMNLNRELMKETKEELPNRPSRHASKVKLQDNVEEENLKSKKMGKKGKLKKDTEIQLTSSDSKTDVAMCEETKLNNSTTNRQTNSKKIIIKEKVKRKKKLSNEVDHINTDEIKTEKKDNIGGDNVRKRMREMSGLLSGNDTVERGGKKLKMKPRRVLLNSRKNVEEKIKQLQVSSDEDADVAQDLHARERGFRKNVAKKMKQESGKKFLPKKGINAKRLKKTLHDEGGECAKNVKDVASVDNPVRQSRRIAQLKIREEAERRQMEEVALREMKEKHKKKSTKDNEDDDWRDSSADRASVESIVKKAKVKVKIEKKQKGSWKKWGSSSGGGGSDSESEEPDYEPEEPEDCGILKSDHEFSPESDLETEGVPQEPQRRARTLKKDDEKEDVETEGACTACGGRDHPEWILLCDACDAGHHASCLKPMLWLIPDGNWYCPPCQHARLVETLESELMKYDMYAQTIDEEKNKKITELAADDQQEDPDEDSESRKYTDKDVTSSDSKSSSDDSEDEEEKVYRLRERRQLPVSYRFKEYDQLMSSAIKEEYQETVSAAGNMGRGKDISTIIEADKEEKQKAKLQSQMGVGDESKEYTAEQKLQEKARKAASRKKPRKLNSLEVISEDDDDNSDEDFKETGWSMSSSDVSTEVDEATDTSRSSDSLPIRRSQRSTYTERRRVVESPEAEKKKKKKKRIFDDTTSSESSGTRDWANRKKKKALHKARIDKPRKIRRKKSSKVLDENGKKANPRVTYGGLSGSDESHDWSPAHRTRQRKIDYTEMPNTESEDEMHKPSGKHMPDSSDEYKVDDSDQSSDSGRGRNKGKGLKIESSEEEKPVKAEAAAIQELKEEKDEASEEKKTVGAPLETLSEDTTAKTEVSEGMQSDDPSPKAEIGKLGARPLKGKGSRGGRQIRGARGSTGRGRSAAAGARAADPDHTDETLINLIGVKIKDLTQDTGSNTDKLDSPEKVERERRRKEKEAKLMEKEQRKIERLKKKEEKELLKEQKAKEKEAKKLARIAFLESKKQRKSKEYMGMEGGPIPIMGVAPGLAVGHLPRGAGRPSLSVKRGLTVRPFTERIPGRDFGRPRMEDARTSQFLPLGPRACFPSGQGPMAPTQDQRTRPPGATGPRGEPIMPADPAGCGAPPGARLHPLAEAEGRAGASHEFRSGFTAGRDVLPAGPRLQVRPELRRMRPDLSHLQRPAFAPDHRLLELGTMPSISVIDEAKLCGREPIKKSQGEGTLSVAGSPQPFKPATDAPSVITRMPHMMSAQYRASSIYGSSPSMFGQGCGPPPHMAMYHRSRHPADGAPPPGSRAPYPGPYYPPLQMYPQRFPPVVHRPGRPPPNAEAASAEEPPKVKVEIKSEPEFSTASPPPEETVAPRSAPAPASTETPRLKVKHTESKERPPARARLTAAARYPHGPYAPQYVPFGPYAPPVSSSETFPSSHAPQLSRTNVEPASASSSDTVARSTAAVSHGTPLQSASSVSVAIPSGLVRNPVKSDISRLKETLVPIVRSPQPPAEDRQMRPADAEQDVHGPSVVSPPRVAGPTEEESGVFGGLVSYFSSQHEDDIDG